MGLFKAVVVIVIFIVILNLIESHHDKNMIAKTLYPIRHYAGIGGVALVELF